MSEREDRLVRKIEMMGVERECAENKAELDVLRLLDMVDGLLVVALEMGGRKPRARIEAARRALSGAPAVDECAPKACNVAMAVEAPCDDANYPRSAAYVARLCELVADARYVLNIHNPQSSSVTATLRALLINVLSELSAADPLRAKIEDALRAGDGRALR